MRRLRYLPLAAALIHTIALHAQPTDSLAVEEEYLDQAYTDSVEASYHYATGRVVIADGAVTLDLPEGYHFLDSTQSRQVVQELWENPPEVAAGVIGIIFPPDARIWDHSFTFWLSYSKEGHVSDADASGIDYAKMLDGMMADDSLNNAQRAEAGFERLHLVGWASPPYYDAERKVLHWALEYEREEEEENALNYNVRVLGRKGVLELDAVGGMGTLDDVKAAIPAVLDIAKFSDGYRYDQFDPATDREADHDLSGLVDGNLKEKVGEVVKVLRNAMLVFLGFILLVGGLVVWLIMRRRNRTA